MTPSGKPTLRTIFEMLDFPYKEEGPVPKDGKKLISVGWDYFGIALEKFGRKPRRIETKQTKKVVYLNEDGIHLVKVDKPQEDWDKMA